MAAPARHPRLRRVYKYGFFAGMDPVCPARVAAYPELAAVRDASPAARRAMDPEDLTDAGRQWTYTTGIRLMQWCHEEGCGAVRPMPLAGYPPEAQASILQHYIRSTQMEK